MRKLSDLKRGESGTILGFEDEDLSLKLMEMGCLPGEKITVKHVAPLGDPISIKVSGYMLSIRKQEAAFVLLED
ncbi:MAG: ferrous iron transport protein A [Bacteroidetes bacterium]|nr:ferrous iron transport protein A [Bacteroidota bacterium]